MHVHAERIRGGPDKGAVQRQRLIRIRDDRDGDKSGPANAAAGRIEIDPASMRQIDLRPRMGCPMSLINSRTNRRFLVRLERKGEIARDKSRGEPESARRLDHQKGEATPPPVAEPQRLDTPLDSLGLPPPVEEALMDALGEADEEFMRADCAIVRGYELAGPPARLRRPDRHAGAGCRARDQPSHRRCSRRERSRWRPRRRDRRQANVPG